MSRVEYKFRERYAKLNSNQKRAVDKIFGPVLVIAGPGSGKTELLSIRTAKILNDTDSVPGSILLLTFTESAAFNMRERLVSLIGENAHRVGIFTFHSFASSVLSENSDYFFDSVDFKPASEIDQVEIVENILSKLPRGNPLSSYHNEKGYIYLKDIISRIKDLKKGNFDPESFGKKIKTTKKEIKDLRSILKPLEIIGSKRKYSEVLTAYIQIYNALKKHSHNNEIAYTLFNSLEISINNSSKEEKSTHLTEWKNKFTKKIATGEFILKDGEEGKLEKLEALAEVYESYQKELNKRTLYDFEDMILIVSKGFKENSNLRADLQERYQYIMIDEFQDTNDSQFDLILGLTKNDSFDFQPNILAVGDDDQAIYKFQGAQIGNIYTFINNFKDVEVVVLDKNYRSTQKVLDYARSIITKAEDRLENRDKNINKKIESANPKYTEDLNIQSTIESFSFENEISEYVHVSEKIQTLIQENKVDPSEICVICRKHEQLKELSNVMSAYSLPYTYEKRESVLEKKQVIEIINILKYVSNLDDESLLPEILTYEAFGLSKVSVWKIAIDVKNNSYKKSWLEVLMEDTGSESEKLKTIATFFIEVSGEAKSVPIEYIIDKIVSFGYREKYANEIDFIFSLRIFIDALKEFKKESIVYAKDVEDFINLYKENGLSLNLEIPFSTNKKSVSLMTAHKAKGLEFEYVFLLSVNQNVWGRAGYVSKISLPINMKLSPDKDNDDDKLRLLYVALTRAKHTIYVTHNSHKLEYLNDDESIKIDVSEVKNNVLERVLPKKSEPIAEEELHVVREILKNYQMPVTHLNNFLDFTKVGPSKFLEQNVLRFPQPMNTSSAYGSAIHSTIEKYYKFFEKENKYQKIADVVRNFREALVGYRLKPNDYKKLIESGEKNLKTYIKFIEKRKILKGTKVEAKFTGEGVVFGVVKALGNIDRLEFVGDEVMVTDMKTGSTVLSLDEENSELGEYEKIKIHFYKYQLVYYQLLLENSRTYKDRKVKVAKIEFVESQDVKRGTGEIVILNFDLQSEEGMRLKERVFNLSQKVYTRIMNLDFPDTSEYPLTLKGILEFEDYLLNSE